MRFSSVRCLAAVLAASVLACAVPVCAGTTGSVGGFVTTAAGAPVAGATIKATSPSQTASVQTDAAGHFTFLSLAPDTYTLSATKAGYAATSITGIAVFADQIQNVHIALQPALKTIASVTARSSMDLVKSGTTTDVYSVNATVTNAVQGVGGGGGLNNAYSAIATVPGAFVPPNQQGWFQTVYIRGGNYDQVGYEFDGVPVNRSFDNYPGGTAGTLGQQELQVYTGGGTAGESASGLAGFINQVIKTGTYPGFANVNAGVGAPAYYHHAQVEAGGSTPDRLFSYYVGIGGYNQDYRYLDQFNGASLGDTWGYSVIADNTANLYFGGVYPTCLSTPPQGSGLYDGPNPSPVYDPFDYKPGQPGYVALPKGVANDPGCYQTISPAYSSYSNLSDRESVVNLHIGIPHKRDSGRDDIQILYDNDMLLSQYYSSANDIGPNLVYQLNQLYGYGNKPEVWGDFVTWPAGTYFGENAADVKAAAYFEPASPGDRCANISPSSYGSPLPAAACAAGSYSAIPSDTRDGFWNNAGIVKLQYQHNIGSTAYFRIYGYTFYSDWLQNGPLSYASQLYGLGVLSYDYELESHTRGLAFSFADQLSSSNQLTFDANYTTATTNRFNNTQYNETIDTPATNYTNGSECFDPASGARTTCNLLPVGASTPAEACPAPNSCGTFGDPTPPVAHPVAGAQWEVTNSGSSGFVNTVVPNFTALALDDRWNPTDRVDVDLGLRDENYEYNLANTNSDGQDFWFTAGQNEFCYNPVTLQPYVIPAKPQTFLPSQPWVGLTCPIDYSIPAHPVQTVHPNGQDGHLLLSNDYSPTLSQNALTPRVGVTYTLNTDTVLRFSAGRFAQEPETYQVQYNAKDSNLAYDLFQAFWQYGYTTPKHDPLVQYSNNYDASLEQRFKGTDMSIKLTPYYRYATNQIYSITLPYGLSGGLNSGTERVDGLEFAFNKGDFNRNGLSFLLSYTYTNSAEMWNDYPGTSLNPIDPYNQDILNFNGLTKAGGGSPCYSEGAISPLNPTGGVACSPSSPGTPVYNPYYKMSPQPLLNRSQWFPVGLDYAYLSPNTLTAVVNYRHNRFAVTPSLTFNEGAPYGNPADVTGIDPRDCSGNSKGIASAPSIYQADYTTCGLAVTQNGTAPGELFIPDPATGKFDNFGAFRQPSQMNLSLNLSYDISPRVKLTAVLANLANACFGGSSEPWTKQYPPNTYTCGYISNYFNGSSPNDRAANGVPLNPAFASEFIPAYADTNTYVLPGPFNMFVQATVRL
ncbi:MAG TPA: TonB-dependent receptor [Verrucomicrobiae bacterium]|nr:TonB-dependent receptor [Verrucomicrobiae bacterium]